MKKIFSILFGILFAFTTTAQDVIKLPIDRVYDGDTIMTHISMLSSYAPLNKISIRVNGIDTPERPAKSYTTTGKLGRAKCKKEAELALKATEFLQKLAAQDKDGKMEITNYQWGKFGGRILGDVNIAGYDVATVMIQMGFAREYHGEKKQGWCE